MGNEELKSVYNSMHSQGASAWYGQGHEERELILEMGEPWGVLQVLEIGCGEGDLAVMMHKKGALVRGIDYSLEAIGKTKEKEESGLQFICGSYTSPALLVHPYHRIVMQGVLEHLDDPLTELKWMIDNLLSEHGDVITSSPAFFNLRGIVWMTLDAIGAVMSKTDLHFIDGHDIEDFCKKNGYGFKYRTCDFSWACYGQMIEDFNKRLPLALKDGGISFKQEKIDAFLNWLKKAGDAIDWNGQYGATAAYRITK